MMRSSSEGVFGFGAGLGGLGAFGVEESFGSLRLRGLGFRN